MSELQCNLRKNILRLSLSFFRLAAANKAVTKNELDQQTGIRCYVSDDLNNDALS